MNFSIVYKFSLTAVFLVVFSVSAVGWVFYSKTTELLVNEALDDISINIRNASTRLREHILVQHADVLFLANMPPIQGMLRSKNKEKYDAKDKSTFQQWVKRQQSIFISMLKSKPEYLTFRFIDKNGQELIVVSREGNKAVVVSSEKLQNKAHRTYFIETLKLPKNSVYLSEINLNREYGKISIPHHEVLRSSSPVYNEVSGEVAGILVITAEIGHELKSIQENVKKYGNTIYITNDRGGYLLHPDASKTYGFDLGKHYRIQEDFPHLAKFYLPDNEDLEFILRPKDIGGELVINFTKIPFDPNKPERFIAVGMTERYSDIVSKQAGVLNNVVVIALLLTVVAALLAILFSFRLSRPIKQITQVMDDYTHDRTSTVVMPTSKNDEIGLLVKSYEDLIAQVEESKLDLKWANKNLESRVAERTLALRISEQRQSSIVNNIVDGLITIDDIGSIESFNPAAEKIFGYQLNEVMGQNIKMLMPEPYHTEHDGYLKNYNQSGEKKIIGIGREVEGKRKDGSIFSLELSVSELSVSGQKLFTGVVRDITERLNNERIIAESELRQRSILENIVDGLLTINEQGIVESFNSAAMKIFGYQPDEVIGQNIKMLMPEPYHTEHDGYLKNYNQTGEKKIIGIGREVVGKRKDGSTFPMDLSVAEMKVNGKIIFTGVVRDITERKQMDKMKNEFISTVSHELRTPLTSIRGSLGLLTSGVVGELPDSANAMLKIASNNTERLLLLINDILDIQKIESGKMNFNFKALELMPFLEQAVTDHAEYGKQHGVTFVITKAMDSVLVYADKDRLMQVMGNLLSNAAKFSPDGEKVEISVAQHHDDRLRISVTDHGTGIPDEFQPIIFERFTQSDSSDTRAKGGTGLGLSITKVIVEKHGGLIDFVSKEGIGSTFYIELPKLIGETAPSDSTMRALPNEHLPCVLIVEDDPDVAALIQRMLAEAGFNSDIAYDASQARQLLAEKGNCYRLMTLDIVLPGEDGLSLLTSLRKEAATRNLPVVVLSVQANEAKRELNGGAIGVEDWLSKPIDQKRLIDVVKRASKSNHQPRVLHVEDDEDVHAVVAEMLKDLCELIWTTTVKASRDVIQQGGIDLVLLDIGLPDGSGLDLLEDIEIHVTPPQVVIFSALDVSEEYAGRVNAVLVKSKTNNEKLLEVLVGAMK